MKKMRCLSVLPQKNNAFRGFTLIEDVFGLIILSLVVSTMQVFMQTGEKITLISREKNSLEWHLFLSQLENRSKNWQVKIVKSQQLVISDQQEKQEFEITPHKNQLKIKKRGGYEPLLTKVSSSHFYEQEGMVVISVVMEDGKAYQGIFPKWSPK